MYIFIASILIIASCEKPTGDTGGNTPAPKQWHVSTVAGSTRRHVDATGKNAKFNHPYGIAVSPDGTLYVADRTNDRIRKIDGTLVDLEKKISKAAKKHNEFLKELGLSELP